MNDNKKTKEELNSFWLQMGQDNVKKTLDRQEEAAKQIISLTSVLEAIYFAAISFSDLKTALTSQNIPCNQLIIFVAFFVSPIIFWLLSLGFAIRVAVPVTKIADLKSPRQLGDLYVETVNYKSKYLRLAHVALVLGFVPLAVNIVIYIVWV
jgi:hypothetical protein